ncbi:MAG: c-type cytochrome [Xanthomonadales bacterium]|nr:c-type cytochrome [Xanthomonadales bacterium]
MGSILRSSITILVLLSVCAVVNAEEERSFEDELERVEEALRTNPGRALPNTLDSCRQQQGYAVKLYHMGMETRARRALKFCFDALEIPDDMSAEEIVQVSQGQLKSKADREYKKAMTLTPDATSGLEIYRECAACHNAEGWGRKTGSVPQIAGQHRKVIIRQLADIRAGHRESVVMIPYAASENIGGAQAMADVAAYIESLEISVDNGKGPGDNLQHGESLYTEYCASCHGATGEGGNEELMPRIQAQHFRYLVRQFEWIRDGKRGNANAKMVSRIQGFDERDVSALMDYVSRLQPAEELRAPLGWKNPDFN